MLDDITIDLSGIDGLFDKHLPDPDLLEFYRNCNDRIIIWNNGIDDSFCSIGYQIMRYNMEDKDKPVEDRTPIKLFINSNGGEIDATFYVMDIIAASKTPVYTIGMSRCYSAGGLILMGGHKRFIFKNTKFLLHDGAVGDVNSMGKFSDHADFVKESEKRMMAYVTSHTNITEKEYSDNYRRDWYMFADEIIARGVADKIIESVDEII